MENHIQLELRKFVAPEFIFGTGARHNAGNYCIKLGGDRLFLATDEGVRNQAWFGEITAQLDARGIPYHIYSGISPNPRDHEVMEGAQQYRDNRCNLILAVGGGSVLDCAKGIGIIVSNGDHITRFEGVDRIPRPIPPLVCIPTTGGTSADVSQFAIINHTGERYKMALISKAIVPDVALVDPEVLQTMDSYLTACTGMDVLSHAFEAYVSNASSPFTDLHSLEAIRLVRDSLLDSQKNPYDMQSRGKMMLASLYAGLAFSNASLGAVHSLAHSLGGYLDLAHGECNALLLPHVVDFNFHHAADKYRHIAGEMGVHVAGLSDREARKMLTFHLLEMNRKLGITGSLKERGVQSDLLPLLAGKAIQDPCNATNPRPPVRADLEAVYAESM